MSLKDDPARTLIDRYPSRFDLRILFGDVDVQRHVNNVAIGRYFEEGRATLNMGCFGAGRLMAPSAGVQLLFVSLTIEYLAQVHYPGAVTVVSGIDSIGRSSWTIGQAIFQNGLCVALSQAVTVKAQDGRSAPLSADERTALASGMVAGGDHPIS